ncbi:SGNH/GDSL hydrolase family protein [Arthrobacter sp. R1-13]
MQAQRFTSVLVASAVIAFSVGCTANPTPVAPLPSSATPSSSPQQSIDENPSRAAPAPTSKSVTFAAIGDSITEANSSDFLVGKIGSRSWVSHVGPGARFAGGWALSGARSAAMAENASDVEADVLVILAGTNDVYNGVPFEQSAGNLVRVAEKVGAQKVLVSAIPPIDIEPGLATRFNQQLKQFALSRGWVFVDPMAGVRQGDRFAPGMTTDGVHPTEAAAQVIGEALGKAIAE